MLSDFLNYIEEHKLIRSNDRILLAVSGGMDSMVMAHLFFSAGLDAAVAHCNFCLRGNESDSDEELVKQYASAGNIPFFSKKFNTEAHSREKGISVQMAARELRYEWFEKIRAENHFSSVAVAHNLNDNIETLVLNLIRGTGITGLTGMKPLNGSIIRPLLFATREKISNYCLRNKITCREDQSNAEIKYSRNKIRHLVIPVMKEINPSAEVCINETAHRLAEINGIMTKYINDIRDEISYAHGEKIIIEIKNLEAYSYNKTMIYELFRPYGISASTASNLLTVIKGRTGGKVYTPTHRILKNREQLIVSGLNQAGRVHLLIPSVDELRKIPFIRSAGVVTIVPGFDLPSAKNIACLDQDKIVFPLIIRNWNKGDYFHPLGMNHKKKLSDYFIDRKYSQPEKEEALVLESDRKIAWIIGERIDDRFRITNQSGNALMIEIIK